MTFLKQILCVCWRHVAMNRLKEKENLSWEQNKAGVEIHFVESLTTGKVSLGGREAKTTHSRYAHIITVKLGDGAGWRRDRGRSYFSLLLSVGLAWDGMITPHCTCRTSLRVLKAVAAACGIKTTLLPRCRSAWPVDVVRVRGYWLRTLHYSLHSPSIIVFSHRSSNYTFHAIAEYGCCCFCLRILSIFSHRVCECCHANHRPSQSRSSRDGVNEYVTTSFQRPDSSRFTATSTYICIYFLICFCSRSVHAHLVHPFDNRPFFFHQPVLLCAFPFVKGVWESFG